MTGAWGNAKEVNPMKYTDISTSVCNIGGFVGAAILPTLIGNVFDTHMATLAVDVVYQKAFTLCWISSIIGFLFTLTIKETKCVNIYESLYKTDKAS